MSVDLTTHPDWLALCAAVCATPGDDLPRLVAADWLDENGHGEYAEFVRVQVELAKSKPFVPPADIVEIANSNRLYAQMAGEHLVRARAEYEAKQDALRRRERELGRAYGVHWFAPPPGFVVRWGPGADTSDEVQRGMSLYHVRRGFVAEVRAPLTSLLGGPCERCDNTEWDYPPELHASIFSNCPACSGTGRTPGVLPRLVGRQPVERVGVSDREPAVSPLTRGHRWYRGPAVSDPRSVLPDEVYDRFSALGVDVWPAHFTAADCKSLLSAAVLKRAGEMAGELTPLPRPPWYSGGVVRRKAERGGYVV